MQLANSQLFLVVRSSTCRCSAVRYSHRIYSGPHNTRQTDNGIFPHGAPPPRGSRVHSTATHNSLDRTSLSGTAFPSSQAPLGLDPVDSSSATDRCGPVPCRRSAPGACASLAGEGPDVARQEPRRCGGPCGTPWRRRRGPDATISPPSFRTCS